MVRNSAKLESIVRVLAALTGLLYVFRVFGPTEQEVIAWGILSVILGGCVVLFGINININTNFILTDVSYVPTYSHAYQNNNKPQYRVVPVADTIRKIKDGTEPFLTTQDLPTLEQVFNQTSKMLGKACQF